MSADNYRGFFSGLTENQKKAALDYRGPENHGEVAFSLAGDSRDTLGFGVSDLVVRSHIGLAEQIRRYRRTNVSRNATRPPRRENNIPKS